MDNEGSIETAQIGPNCHQLAEDRRIDLVMRELGRYNITVGALQETKWFGNATYRVGKSYVIAAGDLHRNRAKVDNEVKGLP